MVASEVCLVTLPDVLGHPTDNLAEPAREYEQGKSGVYSVIRFGNLRE